MINSDPAFPVFPESDSAHAAAFRGMTLRDYFAAQVISMIMGYAPDRVKAAESAYKVADAMMEARAK